jgi:hypothetical protein
MVDLRTWAALAVLPAFRANAMQIESRLQT